MANQEKEIGEADNVVGSPALALDVHQLPADETVLSGQLSPADDRLDFYKLEGGDPGECSSPVS